MKHALGAGNKVIRGILCYHCKNTVSSTVYQPTLQQEGALPHVLQSMDDQQHGVGRGQVLQITGTVIIHHSGSILASLGEGRGGEGRGGEGRGGEGRGGEGREGRERNTMNVRLTQAAHMACCSPYCHIYICTL